LYLHCLRPITACPVGASYPSGSDVNELSRTIRSGGVELHTHRDVGVCSPHTTS